jgi:hypothetical protein
MFFVRKKGGATNHVAYAFHHKLTTQVPPQNSKKSTKTPAKTLFSQSVFFLGEYRKIRPHLLWPTSR